MKKIQNLFLITFIFSVISYVEYAFYAYTNNIVVDFTYSQYESLIHVSKFGEYIRYIKDILVAMILVFAVMDFIFKRNNDEDNKIKIAPFIFIIIFIVIEGIGSSAIGDSLFLSNIISGMRGLLYLTVVVIVAIKYNSYEFYLRFCKLLNLLMVFEVIVVMLQTIQLINIYSIKYIATIRLCGTFGHCGNIAYFLLGYIMNEFLKEFIIIKKVSKIKITINMFIVCSIIYITGSRSALILGVLILLVSIYLILVEKVKGKKILLDIVAIITVITTIPFITMVIEFIAKRGSILEVNKESGRIKVILDYINNENIKNVLFGKGIGFGTNTAVILKQNGDSNLDVAIMDGTINTIITQFGLLTLTIIIILIMIGLFSVIRKSYGINIVIKLTLFSIFSLLSVTVNILEQYSFLLMAVFIILSIRYRYINNVNMKKG